MDDVNDPKRWMRGFPPAEDVWIRFDAPKSAQFPQLRWAMNHYRELAPTKTVRRAAQASALPVAGREAALDALSFTAMTGESVIWADAFASIHTDGLCVLHKGRITFLIAGLTWDVKSLKSSRPD